MGGWMGGWVDGWMDGKAGLRIAYSNQKQGGERENKFSNRESNLNFQRNKIEKYFKFFD